MLQLLLGIWTLFHPIHVTVTSVEYFGETDSFTVIAKFFTDDFHLHFHEFHQTELIQIGAEERKEAFETLMKEEFSLKVNGEELNPVFENERQGEEEIWLTFKYASDEDPEDVIIGNKLLLKLYIDQQNLLIYKDTEIESAFEFNARNTDAKVR